MAEGNRRSFRSITLISLCLIVLASCGAESVQEIHAQEDRWPVNGLKGLVAASGLIIQGHVTAAEPGRVEGEDAGHEIQYRTVMVEVTHVLKGSTSLDLIEVDELGWDSGKPVALNGYMPSEVGTDAIFFLVEGGPHPSHILLNYAQSRYVIDGSTVRGPDQEDPLVRSLQQLTPEELREKIRAAARP